MIFIVINVLIVDFRPMSMKEFGHTKSADLVSTKDLSHLFVGDEELFVLRILEVIFLNICPKLFDTFSTGSLVLSDYFGKVSTKFHGFQESMISFHFIIFVIILVITEKVMENIILIIILVIILAMIFIVINV